MPTLPANPAVGGPQKQTITESTPPEIADAIRAVGLFVPNFEKPHFTKYRDLYQLYLDLLELDYLKLQGLVDRHNDTEPATKLKLRQTLAAVFNLVPSVLNVIRLYIFSEDPAIDVKGNPILERFVADCDGRGTSYLQFVRNKALPLSMLFGWVDILVQNPLVTDRPHTEAEAQKQGVQPRVYPIVATQRINWSRQTNGAYNWLCFLDKTAEDPHPLRRNAQPLQSYITIGAYNPDFAQNPQGDTGTWVRSWMPFVQSGSGTPPLPAAPAPTGSVAAAQWVHEADWTPTKRVTVATLYHQESIDPETRGDGVSKIAGIAVLTRLIVQILSWTTEDILASLAIMAMPSPGGRPPKKEDGTDAVTQLDAFSLIFYSDQATNPPRIVQGSKDHIEVKLKLVEMCIQEILRQAHFIGASGKAENVTSGVQGTVMRSELHQELKDTAENLDRFSLETFSLVLSYATGEDWDVERLQKEVKPVVSWFKGPYTMDAVDQVVKNCVAVMEIFREISPTMAENALKQTARAYLPSDDQDLPKILKEIDENTGKALEAQSMLVELAGGAAAASGKATSSATVSEQDSSGTDAETPAEAAAK